MFNQFPTTRTTVHSFRLGHANRTLDGVVHVCTNWGFSREGSAHACAALVRELGVPCRVVKPYRKQDLWLLYVKDGEDLRKWAELAERKPEGAGMSLLIWLVVQVESGGVLSLEVKI